MKAYHNAAGTIQGVLIQDVGTDYLKFCVFMSGAGHCALGPNSYLEQTKKSGGLGFTCAGGRRLAALPAVTLCKLGNVHGGWKCWRDGASDLSHVIGHFCQSPVFLSLNLCVLY